MLQCSIHQNRFLPDLGKFSLLQINQMPENYNLACAIYRHSLGQPGAIAIAGPGGTVTYGELAARASTLAQQLRSHPAWPDRQNAPAPRVGILASRSVNACVALLGACWAGASYVPINPKLPAERLRALLKQCELTALVTETAVLAMPLPDDILDPGTPVLRVDAADPINITITPPAAMAADDLAYIIFTSGTTGTPKGVMIPAGAARHYAATIVSELGLRSNDRVLETCELSFDFSVHNMFATWEAGAALHILPATQVMNAVKFMQKNAVTVWNSVPSLAGLLRQVKALAPNSLAGVRITVFGGEQLPSTTVEAWRLAAPNSTIHNLYGPTEATVFCMGQQISEPLPLTPGRDVIAIGQPLPGCSACIIDTDGQPLPDGTPGELAIGGIQLASGYFGAPALTAERFPTLAGQRWYRTGDQAVRTPDGIFHCLGRIDNQVKVFGYRVELEEIDTHLRTVSGTDLVGAVAWPLDDGMARGIVGFIAMNEVDAQLIISQLKARLAPYMVPSRIVGLAQMPLNASGKVDRRALQNWLEKHPT